MTTSAALALDEEVEQFAADMAAGLSAIPKRTQPKWFYDRAGSELFEDITRAPEYYPTAAELSILENNAEEIAACVPPGGYLVELGAGSTTKIRLLLDRLGHAAGYVPVDISGEFLAAEAAALRQTLPNVKVFPVAADFTRPFKLPAVTAGQPLAGFFPGSTIGNFDPVDAAEFLRHVKRLLGPGATLIIGIDLRKDPAILEAAYDDAGGVTAAFNRNLLVRANRELDADFDTDAFAHRAVFNEVRSRVEMHLVSLKAQKVRIRGRAFSFAAGETIHTECSYKYTVEGFRALASSAGWHPKAVWLDDDRLFSVHALTGTPAT
jgi:dimethylhistidine N-methyltransferase